MSWDWKDTVRKVAPAIGGALGGPLGGAAMTFLSNTLLGKPDGTEQEIAAWVGSATPEQLLKLKEADQRFELEIRRLDVEDRKSARELAGKDIRPQVVISAVYTVAYAAVLWAFVGGEVALDESVRAEFSIVLGVLTAAQGQVLNFWFGSSSGSKQKTAQLTQHQ